MPTNLTIGGYSFVCVCLSEANFQEIAAIYVIICVVDKDGSWKPLDVGQTGELGTRIVHHKYKYGREECWHNNCPTDYIWVCVHKMPSKQYTKQDRLDREKELRKSLNPPCGER